MKKPLSILLTLAMLMTLVSMANFSVAATSVSLFWPANSRTINSYYGSRSYVMDGRTVSDFHLGIDIAGSIGDPIYAAADGTVVKKGWGDSYGNQIILYHPSLGIYTNYAHASQLLVEVGQSVSAGQKIGLIGATGNVTGPHLHFETRTANSSNNTYNPLDNSFYYEAAPANIDAFDVNMVLNGETYALGVTGITFDVYINGQLMANDVQDYANLFATGASYTINDLKATGSYAILGATTFSGKVDGSTVNIICGEPALLVAYTFGNNRYELYNGAMTWTAAKTYAESKGGHLATVNSAEEQQIIEEHGSVGGCWLGATESGHIGTWSWVTGEPFSYTNWSGYQPDNATGYEHYLGFFNNATWNDYELNYPGIRGFLVEYENANPTTTETEPSVTNPTVTEPSETEPSVTDPSMTEPSAAEPTATETEPTETKPSEFEPTATALTETDPSNTEPSAPAASLLGDANDAGAVNMKDVLALRKFLAGMDVSINITNSDTNEDTFVNMKDVLLMRKFLANLVEKLGA